jgi:hypothetical protein
MFFVLLAGAIGGSSLNHFYFLQADTSNIAGAMPVSRWTLWNICGDNNQNCGPVKAAYPFNPEANFGTQNNLSSGFIGYVHTSSMAATASDAPFYVHLFFADKL